MASGGGTPPSHLSIPQLPNNFPSAADTLKTPQLTLTPVTSINSAVDGGGKSFTSLEELLNITGINTPTGSRPDNGVSSLSRIAQAVENSQNAGPQGDLPPAKRPRLELPSNTNIRVQPLTSPSVTIASLLHKPSNANHTGSNIPTTNFNPTNTPQSINSTVAQALSALTHVLSANSSSINATLSQAVSTQPTIVSVIPSLMQSPATSPTSSNPKSFLLQLVQLYKHYQNTGDSDGMERIKKQLNVLVTATQGRNQPSNPLLGALSMLSGPSTTVQQQVSSGANSLINRTQTTSTVLAGTTVSRPNMHVPPSLLSSTQLRTIPSNSRPQAAVTTGMTATRATNPSPQATTSTALAEQISVQQKAVKQLQTIMASLPVSSRPKTAQEIRDFVQKYSNLITQLQSSTPSTTTSAQSTKTQQNPVTTLHGSVVVPMNFGPSPAQTTTTANSTASISTTAMAQVDQHFQTALTAVKNKSTLPTKPLAVVDLTTDTDSASTVNAPITTQFKATPKATKATTGIQAGVATPLPPGLTLETLAVLCRLPESELGKLKLPVGLLSAIKVWKEKQPTKKGGSPHTKTSSSSNIPILYPPSSMSGPSHLLKTPTAIKVGEALSLTSTMSDFKQPFVIPSGAGFPPRSLHAFVPGLGQGRSAMTSTAAKLFPTAATPHRPSVTLGRPPSHHMTRVRTKAEQEKAERERIQALTKALQSSEEARIAFRFNTHLDKMHSQLLAPDTTTSFANKQDVLSRLLPYHVYAQCEPPVAAVEKADAVFESVAQVLLSRSRGLQSRFQQLLAKTDSRGGEDAGVMDLELRRCFVQGERERVQQEKLQKQQAEQVAANLSMMVKADGVDTFDSEFSLSDAFFPFLDNGIT